MQSPSRPCWPKQTKNIVILLFLAEIIITQTDLNYSIACEFVRRVQLSPMVVILGIVAGAALAGVLGVVLAAPSIAIARVLGRYIYTRLFEVESFSDPTTQPLPALCFVGGENTLLELPRRQK